MSPDTALRDTPLVVPSTYRAGYEKARAVNPDLARRYIEHTVMGDQAADAAVASLADFPQELLDFFDRIAAEPSCFNPDATR